MICGSYWNRSEATIEGKFEAPAAAAGVRTRLDLIVVATTPLRQHLYRKHKNEGQTLSRLAPI